MNKKHLFLWVLLFCIPQMQAQHVKVISNEPLSLPASEMGYSPVISPAGEYVLLSAGDNSGLRMYDLKSKQLTTLTKDRGAGFGVKISDDGKLVAYRSQQYINKLRYTTLKVLDISTKKTKDILKNSRDIEGFTFQEGTIFVIEDGKLQTKRITGNVVAKKSAVSSLKRGQLYMTRYNQTSLVSPAGSENNYLWASVSPDGSKLLYYVIELGQAFVSNLDGSDAVSLGVIRAPKWMGNNWVVGMEDYDDGEKLTASSIVMAAASGTNRTVLTDKSVIATNPSGTSDASTIVYNTDNGKVFLLKLEIAK